MIYKKMGKRCLDVMLSLMGIIILSPLLLGISIAIWITDGSPVIYRQKRLGRDGAAFYIYKFRSMVRNADKVGPLYTSTGDNRITKVGKFIRTTSLDELPQLLNIIKGDMSIVGPRPNIYAEYGELNQNQRERITIAPGLLCLADIKGRSLLKSDEKMKYDLEYVRTYSFGMDVKICLKGALVVLKREGVN